MTFSNDRSTALPPPASSMTSLERRASMGHASLFAVRMLGLFWLLPIFVEHAKTLPDGQIGWLVGLAFGVYGLVQACLLFPLGWLSDIIGRRAVILGGLVCFAVGSLVCGMSDTVWGLLIGRAIQGSGAISSVISASISDVVRPEHRTKAMAMVGGSIGAAFLVALMTAPPLYAHIGMSGLFDLMLGLSLIGMVIAWRIVPAHHNPDTTDLSAHNTALSHVLTTRQLFLQPQLWRLNVGVFILHACQMSLFSQMPSLLIQAGIPLSQHTWVYLPVMIASFAGMLPLMLYGERKQQTKRIFQWAIGFILITQLLLLYVSSRVELAITAVLLSLMLVFFIGFNLLEAQQPALVSRIAPANAKGRAMGLYNTLQSLGLFVGGGLSGLFANQGHAPWLFALNSIMLMLWWLISRGMIVPIAATTSTNTPPPSPIST
jgi:MFS family permease